MIASNKILFVLYLYMLSFATYAESDLDYLYSLSLEDLSEISVTAPAAITKLSYSESPARTTVITAKDIKHTPARNIYDLLEIYVPGGFWINHEEGPHPGIRGNIASRNYKYLLLVNDRVMNSKAQYGAKSELESWSLDDIKQIEIVRGPGSVVYGPGAVGGVIKIVTHTADSFEGNSVSARYTSEYDSLGASYNFGGKFGDNKLFTHMSVTRTQGDDASQFLVTNDNEAGFIGESIRLDDEPLEYYADYQDDPQVKIHVDAEFSQHWRMWFRYTQQGSTWRGNEVKSEFDGELVNQQGTRDRQLTLSLAYANDISSEVSVKTEISIDSYDAERRGENERNPDPDNVQNFKHNFSEDELLLRGIVNWQANEDVEFALGAEFSREFFGPGWGDDKTEMLLGDDSNIVNGPDSEAILEDVLDPEDAVFVDDGWYSSTYSLFTEGNIVLTPEYRLMLSLRADRHDDSDTTLYSPRAALIHKLGDDHILKFIAQRSQRLNTAGQLYVEEKTGSSAGEESLDSIELSYSGPLSEKHYIDVTGFYNDTEVIDWDSDTNRSTSLGDLSLFGIETEVSYRWKSGSVGVNYSFVKQLDWDMDEDLESNSISYADYDQPLRDTNAVMEGTGNDLNNWPNHALKIFSKFKMSSDFLWHIDARIFWGFDGAKDGLQSLYDAVQGEAIEQEVEASLADVRDQNAYDEELRVNTSLAYKPDEQLDILFYIQNLIGTDGNKRYSYDSGNDRATPRRVRFVEEPRTFGVRVDYRF